MADKKLFTEFSPSTREEWVDATVQSLKGKPFDKLVKQSYEGFEIQPMYSADDIETIPSLSTIPGQFPYIRGTRSAGYHTQAWHITQAMNLSDPQQFNEALKHDLERGQTAIYLDTEQLPLNTVDDAMQLFADIDLAKYPIYIKTDITATQHYNVLLDYLKQKEITQLTGCIGYDPLHHLARTGQVSMTVFENMSSLLTNSIQHTSNIETIAIRTDIYHSAGANAVQELAIALATGVTYLNEMIERGHNINNIASKMRFFLNIGENFFMEIAKLRAIKLMWAQIIKAYEGSDEDAKIKLHASTATRNKTRHDAYVNMLRATTEAMAGALGGVDSLQVSPFDTPFGESDEFSRRIARNVQLILQEEVNLTSLIDPAGGSWYVEHLTDQLAQSSWTYFQKIESQGGMIQALQDGMIQSEIKAVHESRLQNLATRKDVLVGTNMYPNLDETMPEDRPHQSHNTSTPAYHPDDTHVIQIQALNPIRLSEPFEALRANAEKYKQAHGHLPQIFLANFGQLREYKARMDFTRGFYEVGGFDLIDNGNYHSIETAVQATLGSHAPAVVICSTDEKYQEIVTEFTQTIKAQQPEIVIILAGYPAEYVEQYREAGVDGFIHIRANCYDMNHDLHDRLGVGK